MHDLLGFFLLLWRHSYSLISLCCVIFEVKYLDVDVGWLGAQANSSIGRLFFISVDVNMQEAKEDQLYLH